MLLGPLQGLGNGKTLYLERLGLLTQGFECDPSDHETPQARPLFTYNEDLSGAREP